MTNTQGFIVIILALIMIWAVTYVSLDFFKFKVYVVWVIDDAEVKIEKFLGVALSEKAAQRIIIDDQYRRWVDLDKDKWKVEWRYDPVYIKLL